MKHRILLLLISTTLLITVACERAAAGQALGAACGECMAGQWDGTKCQYPEDLFDPTVAPPAQPDGRLVFETDSYSGNNTWKIYQAGRDAQAVGGAVVFGSVTAPKLLEVDKAALLHEGVRYTGGGLRRAATPDTRIVSVAARGSDCVDVDDSDGWLPGQRAAFLDPATLPKHGSILEAKTLQAVEPARLCFHGTLAVELGEGVRVAREHALMTPPTTQTSGIELVSLAFDGAWRDNPYISDARYQGVVALRHVPNTPKHLIEAVWIYDSPSESFTVCGVHARPAAGDRFGVRAFNLAGSVFHGSCSADLDYDHPSVLESTYAANVALLGDEVLGHSEGALWTFSANAGQVFSAGEVVRGAGEPVWGLAGPDDAPSVSVNGCYRSVPAVHAGVIGDGAVERHHRQFNLDWK